MTTQSGGSVFRLMNSLLSQLETIVTTVGLGKRENRPNANISPEENVCVHKTPNS